MPEDRIIIDLNLRSICSCFGSAQKKLLSIVQVSKERCEDCFYSRDATEKGYVYMFNYAPDRKPEDSTPTASTMVDLWLPDDWMRFEPDKDPKSFCSNLMAGIKNSKWINKLQALFESDTNALFAFHKYRDYLCGVMEKHMRMTTYLIAHTNTSASDLTDHQEILNSVERETSNILNAEFTENLKKFSRSFLDCVLDTIVEDSPIKTLSLYEVAKDRDTSQTEGITILSLLSLFAGKAIERGFFEKLYGYLYDDKKKLKPIQMPRNEAVSHETVWRAWQEWYVQTRKKGRFCGIIPNPDLHPNVALPINVQDEGQTEIPLMTRITADSDHLFIVGEGGIGKTTALYSIMKSAYDGTTYVDNSTDVLRQIPMFIELSRAIAPKDFPDGESRFILRSITRQLCAYCNIPNDSDEQIYILNQIESLLVKREDNKPEFLLLLDGMNEISKEEINGKPIVEMLATEIIYITEQFKNVRIIITSRTKEDNLIDSDIESVSLSGLSFRTIEKYLKEKKLNETRIKSAIENPQLAEILKIPLFLILYAEYNGEAELLSRGEILHAFYAQEMGKYSERGRLKTIEYDIQRYPGISPDRRKITSQRLRFMLDFIMPEIAWYMVRTDTFSFSREEASKLIEAFFEDESETSVLGEYGQRCFSNYHSRSGDTTQSVAKEMCRSFSGTDMAHDRFALQILQCLDLYLGVVVTSNCFDFQIIHQHVRDYFAALYHINRLKLATFLYEAQEGDMARKCLSEWSETPLPAQILSFIGEALGELHNAPYYDFDTKHWKKVFVGDISSERKLIHRALDIYRYRFDGEDGYAVWNLFQILKYTREDLSEENFSELDLSLCRANGYRLGNPDFACNLYNTKVNKSFFFPSGHTQEILSIDYSPDGRFILTADRISVRLWDSATFQEIINLENRLSVFFEKNNYKIVSPEFVEHFIINSARYSPNGKNIFVLFKNGSIEIFDAKTYQPISGKENSLQGVEYMEYKNKPSNCFSSPNDLPNNVVWRILSLRPFWYVNTFVKSIEFNPNGTNIVTVSFDGIAQIWDANTFQKIPNGTLVPENAKVQTAKYSPHGERIVATLTNGCVQIWDAKTHKPYPMFSIENHQINEIQYNTAGTRALIVYDSEIVEIWETESMIPIVKLGSLDTYDPCFEDLDISASFSPDGKYILTKSPITNIVEVWDALNFKKIKPQGKIGYHPWPKLGGGTGEKVYLPANQYRFSPDGKKLMISFIDSAQELDAASFQEIPYALINGSGECVVVFKSSSDGSTALALLSKGTVQVLDIKTKHIRPGGILKERGYHIQEAMFSPCGKYILTSLNMGFAQILDSTTLQIWDATTFQKVPGGTIRTPGCAITSGQYSPLGTFIVVSTVCNTGTNSPAHMIIVLDATTFQPVQNGSINVGVKCESILISPDEKFMILLLIDGRVKILDTNAFLSRSENLNKRALPTSFEFVLDETRAHSVNLSPKGDYFIITSEEGTAQVWKCENGHFMRDNGGKLSITGKTIYSARYTQDGICIITETEDRSTQIWIRESNTFQMIKDIDPKDSTISIQSCMDGAYVSSVTINGKRRIYTSIDYHDVNDELLKYFGSHSSNAIMSGLEIWNVDLRFINSQSNQWFSGSVEAILTDYGAIL